MSAPFDEPDRRSRLAICTARREEYEDTLEQISGFSRKLHQNHPYFTLTGPTVELHLTHLGIGPESVLDTLNSLQSVLNPDALLVTGTAGALTDDLTRQTVYIPTAVTNRSEADWLYPTSEFLHWLLSQIDPLLNDSDNITDSLHLPDRPIRTGPLVTSSSPVLETNERTEVHETTQAMAVDMETYSVVNKFLQSKSDDEDENELIWGGLSVISDEISATSFDDVKSKQTDSCRLLGHILERIIKSFS